MSEAPFSPLSELPSIRFEAPKGDYALRVKPARSVLLALGDSGARAPLSLAAGPFALRSAGPQCWLILGETPLSPAEISAREREFGDAIALIDQSHGRERLEISGPGAARKLSTGTAVNLSPSAFPEGESCETLFGHILIHLTKTGPDTFEILVGRSFAASLWRELTS